MKKSFLIIGMSLLILAGCSKNNLISKNSISIPFGTPGTDDAVKMPCIDVIIEDVRLTLLVDSGARHSLLHYSGLKKLNYDKEYELKKVGITEEQYSSELKQAHNPVTTNKYLFIHDSIPVQEIQFFERWYDVDTDFDGMLGFDFFENYSNITIDYNKELIILDAKKLKAENLMLQRDELFYSTDFNFDGVMESAIIDTGLCSITNSEFGIKPIPSIKLGKSNALYKKAVKLGGKYTGENYSLGNIVYNEIYMVDHDDPIVVFINPVASFYVSEFNILSNGCFVDHIIQFDFEDMVFRIK